MPLVPLPLVIAPLASVVGMSEKVTTPVPEAYDVATPAGRLPMVTPLNPLANVSVYVRPEAVDGPALRKSTAPRTSSPALTLAGKLRVVVTSAMSAPPVLTVALSGALLVPWAVVVVMALVMVLAAFAGCV